MIIGMMMCKNQIGQSLADGVPAPPRCQAGGSNFIMMHPVREPWAPAQRCLWQFALLGGLLKRQEQRKLVFPFPRFPNSHSHGCPLLIY